MTKNYFSTNQSQSIENTQSFFSLAQGQRALWHLYQMAPKSTALNIYCTVQFCSEFNLTSWHRAWQKIGERHSILRTTYTTRDGQPVQVVDPHREIELEVTDASNWSEDYLKTQIIATADRPFDLEKGSVLRVQLYTRQDKPSVQVLVMHYIAGDMWSFDILLEELQLLYTSTEMELLEGDSPKGNDVINKIDPLPWQYTDYVSWQQKTLESAKGKQQWAYWKQELTGELPVLNLPTDRRRPPVQTYEGNSQFIELDEALLEKLRDVGKCEGVSLYTLLLAAFLVQLYRYTNQEDILVGSAMAGRSAHQELKKIVGYFSNPVILRANLSGNPTFKEFLAQIRGTVFRALRHQDYPFPLLVEQLDANRDLSRPPLFQVAFTWQKHRWYETASNFSGEQGKYLSMKPYSSGLQRGSVLDLNLQIEEAGSSLVANWQYNTDLFDAATVSRMAGHFQKLLEAIVANPEQCVAQLPLLTEAERNQLIVEWNNTRTEYPKDKCIHQLFEEQVERTPDHVAVVFEDQKLTYRELNAKANQLAHYLQKLGVEPEVLVGICVERSLFMVVGLLGILKAGGTYVPLDPEYPKQRLAFMLSDAQVSVLLTQQRLVSRLPKHGAKMICLDADWEIIAQEGTENPTRKVKADNLAYVIYTSGSTGKPKGVQIEHQGLLNLVFWHQRAFALSPADRATQIAGPAFDAAVWELWPYLTAGASIYIANEETRISPVQLRDWLIASAITITFLPTPLAESVLSLDWPSNIALQTLLTGGDKLHNYPSPSLPFKLVNNYGPTENTVVTTSGDVSFMEQSDRKPTIGRPIANTQVYLLDKNLQPVPVGIPGEIYIGGAGLARGYLNPPDQTILAFIPNPFSNKPSRRLYKTGDLARYLLDGNIEFLGRVDDQVKIRGFRIELGEIEAVLGQHPAMQETVVMVREDIPGNKRLVAYVVTKESPAPSMQELHHFLKQQLPEYMVPSAFVLLDVLPLTSNGKVDRRALPAPDTTRPELADTYVAPRTPVEEVLVGIWAEVLGLDGVGVQDNFFELGGHSLLATQVISRVRDAFSVELSLYSLFEAPAITSLGEKIEAARWEGLGLQAPPILPRTRNENLPLSFAQQRLWFLDQLEPGNPAYNSPLAYRIRGQLNVVALEQTLGEVVRRHEALRTTFTTVDGQPIQSITPEPDLKLPMVDLQEIPETEREEELQRLITEEGQQRFNLDQGLLLRVMLLRLDKAEHVLLLTIHNIIYDGWSLGVFMRELVVLYEAFSTGKPSPLPELPIQYADFAIWQREWLQRKVLTSQLAYWKKQLGGELPVLELPTDRPRPPVQTYLGAKQSFEISKDLTDALKELSQREGVTLFMTLLAAFKTLLYRHTGQEDVIVGSPIANRNRAEIEGLIGFFANTLAIRTYLGNEPSFRELLDRVRDVTLGAYIHQDLPFEKLVEELQLEQDRSRSPLFQVMFVFQNAPMPTLRLSDLILSLSTVDNKTAKFDWLLSLEEKEQRVMGFLEYNTDLFDAATITRIIGHFQTLLQGIVTNPELPIVYLPLLTPAELHQLLVKWNPSQSDYPKNLCLHQLVERQVEKTPDAVAIIFENQQLTYKELNCRANQLAHYLQSLGVESQIPVAIFMELSLNVAVGILGIIKAGGVFVPLELNYPKDRLAFIFEETQVPVLLTQQRLLTELPPYRGDVVCLDTSWPMIAQRSPENPDSGIKPENFAYILYTSGSTGQPKGVMLSHFVCCTRELWEQRTYPMTTTDRILLKSSWSSKEFFWPLLAGATAVMTRQGGYQDSAYLVKLIAEHKITVISVVPSVLKLMLEEPNIESCRSLRHIFCTGEAMPVQLQESFFKKGLPGNLYNLYGLNEVNYTTVWQCQANYEQRFVPIGRPTDMQVYLLDRYLQPVPIAVKGEIYISGVGLASGYFNRPELTQEKFIPNPFSEELGARLFKTGDLARYLPDGAIQYLGRIDHQVKIRGNRTELGEIEAVLRQHPSVKVAAVITREEVSGDKRLVAYLTPNQEYTPKVEQLRRFLQQKLPDYMVPSDFVVLEVMPLTFNGKIDRLALVRLELPQTDPEKTFVTPRTPIEQRLSDIWVQVLGLKQLNIHDNFFQLGGHSLMATQVISRVRQAFEIELPLRNLYEYPTVAELAERVEILCWALQNQHIVSINTMGDSSENSFSTREEISF